VADEHARHQRSSIAAEGRGETAITSRAIDPNGIHYAPEQLITETFVKTRAHAQVSKIMPEFIKVRLRHFRMWGFGCRLAGCPRACCIVLGEGGAE
jgi:hypothetical protein